MMVCTRKIKKSYTLYFKQTCQKLFLLRKLMSTIHVYKFFIDWEILQK